MFIYRFNSDFKLECLLILFSISFKHLIYKSRNLLNVIFDSGNLQSSNLKNSCELFSDIFENIKTSMSFIFEGVNSHSNIKKNRDSKT